jgi:L-aminopeptidase/D-esterase-like protein
MHLVQQVHAILLAGGSAYGLDAAGGVMRYLEDRRIGFDLEVARVPIVPAAILFDLGIGRADLRPDAEMGYQACLKANIGPVSEGNVGAGTGATVGKILGMKQAMKSGLGSSSLEVKGGIVVGALVAVNTFGDVVDPASGRIVAGARSQHKPIRTGSPGFFADTLQVMKARAGRSGSEHSVNENTLIRVVATNVALDKVQANKVAQMAHDGLARTIRPAHTMLDGDTIFALSTGRRKADVNLVGALAAEVLAQAILRAVRAAQPAGGLPTAGSLQG